MYTKYALILLYSLANFSPHPLTPQDTFSYALVLLCLAMGDIRYIRNQARQRPGKLDYIWGKRPTIPDELQEAAPELIALIKEMWAQNFRKRPPFSAIVPRLQAIATTGVYESPTTANHDAFLLYYV